jgi:recombination protein RecA
MIQLGSDVPAKEYIKTGMVQIDEFTGGITRGNFTVMYGGNSAGKSTYAYHIIAECQSKGLNCCYIDLEHSFDVDRAHTMGVNMDTLILVETANTAEEAMDITIKLCREQVVDLIIVDSVQAMSPKQEQFTKTGKELSMEDDSMALLARKLGQFLRVCAGSVYRANCAVMLIGQVRTQGIGGFAPRDGLSGGHALMHWAYQIIYMRRGQAADAPVQKLKEQYEEEGVMKSRTITKPIGFDSVWHIQKNKSSVSRPEGSILHVPFFFESGFKMPVEPVKDAPNDSV